MVGGMGAGLHARACCPYCCSSAFTSSSSSSAAASSSSPSSSFSSALPSYSVALPSLSRRLSNNLPGILRTSHVGLCSSSSHQSSFGSLDWISDTRKSWRQSNDGIATLLLPRSPSLRSSHGDKSPRSLQLRVLPSNCLAERSAELGDGQEESVAGDADLASITEWELDFCSRPIVDSRGKKIWELVVCDSQRQLRFARFYPNNVINSGTLRDALMYIIQTLGVPKPQKVRFFRSQLQTVIGKACAELDIQPVPSQRCIQLVKWLDERFEAVYRQHPGYQEGSGPLVLLEQPLPVDIPDTARGEQWAFVQLPLSVLDEIAAVRRGDNFGNIFDLDTLGLDLPRDATIPGVAVASTKAVPLAATTAETSGFVSRKMSALAAVGRVPFLGGFVMPTSIRQDQHRRVGWTLGFLPIAATCVRQQAGKSVATSRSTLVARAAAQVQEGQPGNPPTAGVAVYQPASYDILVSDAAHSVIYALADGKQRLEVDFPPLPSSISGYKGSSDEFIDANIQLAFTLARKLNELKGLSTRINAVGEVIHLLCPFDGISQVFPDGPERRRALRVFKSALELTKCVSFGSLEDLPAEVRGAARDLLSLVKGFFDFDFEEEAPGKDISTPDVYIVIGVTTNELPGVKEYVDYFAKDLPVILFNLETDTLRSDLGLFGFPPKDVHYKFLSQYQPVFYIRTRDYSKSIPVAPFILNYSGALFRQYPGPWQVMLKQTDGSYACVAENTERYTLFQTKEELLTSLGLQEEAGSTMAFLRSGYKTSTWWEDELQWEESQAWRT